MTAQGTKKNLSKKILLTLFIASTVVPSIASAHPVGDLGKWIGDEVIPTLTGKRPLKINPSQVKITIKGQTIKLNPIDLLIKQIAL